MTKKKECCKKSECKEVEAQEVKCQANDGVIVLEDAELDTLREHDKNLAELKGKLADLFMQKHTVDANLETLANTLETVRNDYVVTAKALAKNHGVDMDKPNQGNWQLNIANKTLTKVD